MLANLLKWLDIELIESQTLGKGVQGAAQVKGRSVNWIAQARGYGRLF
jgi:hypothetical protein